MIKDMKQAVGIRDIIEAVKKNNGYYRRCYENRTLLVVFRDVKSKPKEAIECMARKIGLYEDCGYTKILVSTGSKEYSYVRNEPWI